MSSAQFHATVHCILTKHKLSVQIAALTVVQTSTFGMTLRRKQFITQVEGVKLYALVLLIGMLVIIDDLEKRSLTHIAMIAGNTAAILRMYFDMNKYLLWSLIIICFLLMEQSDMLNDEHFLSATESSDVWIIWVNVTSWLLLFAGSYLQ
jgi:hypothetical protein